MQKLTSCWSPFFYRTAFPCSILRPQSQPIPCKWFQSCQVVGFPCQVVDDITFIILVLRVVETVSQTEGLWQTAIESRLPSNEEGWRCRLVLVDDEPRRWIWDNCKILVRKRETEREYFIRLRGIYTFTDRNTDHPGSSSVVFRGVKSTFFSQGWS